MPPPGTLTRGGYRGRRGNQEMRRGRGEEQQACWAQRPIPGTEQPVTLPLTEAAQPPRDQLRAGLTPIQTDAPESCSQVCTEDLLSL